MRPESAWLRLEESIQLTSRIKGSWVVGSLGLGLLLTMTPICYAGAEDPAFDQIVAKFGHGGIVVDW